MTDIFRIEYKIKKDGLAEDYVKLLVSILLIWIELISNLGKSSWEIEIPANIFVNNCYDFHNLKIKVGNGNQEALKCYKRTDGQFIRIAINLVNVKLMVDLLDKLNMIPKKKMNLDVRPWLNNSIFN